MLDQATTIFLVLILGILGGGAALLIAYLLTKGPEGPFKRKRYEAGNPPTGEAKKKVPYQYYGYIIIYLAVEPIFVILYLLPYTSALQAITLSLIILGIYSPALIYAVMHADRLEQWKI
ncbi:MAG: hypothetical protein DRJ35_08735 [Thermoprotei archaeon]|nr:MAG: hypothetical protein DRJ35_08735 [Thermoprotei archaeon]